MALTKSEIEGSRGFDQPVGPPSRNRIDRPASPGYLWK